jgi:hypothetical protein
MELGTNLILTVILLKYPSYNPIGRVFIRVDYKLVRVFSYHLLLRNYVQEVVWGERFKKIYSIKIFHRYISPHERSQRFGSFVEVCPSPDTILTLIMKVARQKQDQEAIGNLLKCRRIIRATINLDIGRK